MDYILDGKQFVFNYQEVKGKYLEYVYLSDKDFIQRLPEIIHTACFICYVKGFGNEQLSDVGVVHELAHLLHIPDDTELKAVRKLFKEVCLLS